MSSPSTSQVLHPTNPSLSRDLNTPKEKGQTRILQDVPAVRLSDIRPGLVREASRQRTYRFPKKRGYDDTNVTAFVKKDYNYGPKRENRPDRLFQIKNDGAKGEKPDGYVMDRGRIVLDAFDHGLRNFGHQLPLYVSSELEGHDIEDYLRRNREISVYDLIARAPNGYHKGKPEGQFKRADKNRQAREWHDGPPRVGTFSMRATRFRLGAGCLSWERKDGTEAKNQRILEVIPTRFKDPAVNSTRGWRDLNKEEIKRVERGKMNKPQLGRKGKGAAKADKGKGRAVEDSIEEERLPGDGEEFQIADASGSNEQGSDVWPEYNPADFEASMPAPQLQHQNPRGESSRSAANDVNGNGESASFQQDPPPPRKRARSVLAADLSEGSDDRAQKRVRVTSTAQTDNEAGNASRTTTPRVPRKQQKAAARKTSATQGLPASASAATDSNALGQDFPPASSNSGFDSSLPVSNESHGQMYNSSCITNAETLTPDWYNSSWQNGFDDSFFQPPLAQNGNCGTLQPTSSLVEQQPSFSSGSPYLANAITPDSNVQDFDPGYYPSIPGFHPDGTLDYNSAWNAPLQMSSFEQDPNQVNIPFTQPLEWDYSQNLPPSPEVTGKRKRVHDSVTEQPEGQHASKRTKRHTSNPAVVPEVSNPTDPVIGAYDSPFAAAYAGYETTPPEYKYLDMQSTGFLQPEANNFDFSNSLPSAHGESWTGEAFPTQGQGSMPLIGDLDGMPAADFASTYQDVQDGYAYDSYPNQLTDFQSSQWQPAQSDDWYLRWMD